MKKFAILICLIVFGGLAAWSIYGPASKNGSSVIPATMPAQPVAEASLSTVSPQDATANAQLAVATVPLQTSSDNTNKSFAPPGSELARLANTNPSQSYSPPDGSFAHLANKLGVDNWSGTPKVPATNNWSGPNNDAAKSYAQPGSEMYRLGNLPGTGNWSGATNAPATSDSSTNASVPVLASPAPTMPAQ